MCSEAGEKLYFLARIGGIWVSSVRGDRFQMTMLQHAQIRSARSDNLQRLA
jgi:hypothetical protein